MYLYENGGITECIDATDTACVAKMVNDEIGREANSVMKKQILEGRVCLCLFALKDMKHGQELRYDYGQTDLLWRKKAWIHSQTASGHSGGWFIR
ncbi:histone-lysine N-methyltransferase Set8-like isoform X2 [Apostichopus japonicus]|uniref:histone-lysine N-methyltransferase Set8-like isoform X2 n=1 Tax=Stichopus japonicus TaxID=307972 RepID=UPI003AB4CC6F